MYLENNLVVTSRYAYICNHLRVLLSTNQYTHVKHLCFNIFRYRLLFRSEPLLKTPQISISTLFKL
jgi:hypothetical protein